MRTEIQNYLTREAHPVAVSPLTHTIKGETYHRPHDPALIYASESRYLMLDDLERLFRDYSTVLLNVHRTSFSQLGEELLNFLKPIFLFKKQETISEREDIIHADQDLNLKQSDEVNYIPLLYQTKHLVRVIQFFEEANSSVKRTAQLTAGLDYANAAQARLSKNKHPLPVQFLETLCRLTIYYELDIEPKKLHYRESKRENHLAKTSELASPELYFYHHAVPAQERATLTIKSYPLTSDNGERLIGNDYLAEQRRQEARASHKFTKKTNPIKLPYSHEKEISLVFDDFLLLHGITNKELLNLPCDFNAFTHSSAHESKEQASMFEAPPLSDDSRAWLEEVEEHFFSNNSKTTLTPLHLSLLNDYYKHLLSLDTNILTNYLEGFKSSMAEDLREAFNAIPSEHEKKIALMYGLMDQLIKNFNKPLHENFALKFGNWLPLLVVNPFRIFFGDAQHTKENGDPIAELKTFYCCYHNQEKAEAAQKLRQGDTNYGDETRHFHSPYYLDKDLTNMLRDAFGDKQLAFLIEKFQLRFLNHSNLLSLTAIKAQIKKVEASPTRLSSAYKLVLSVNTNPDIESLFVPNEFPNRSVDKYEKGVQLYCNNEPVKVARQALYRSILLLFTREAPLDNSLYFLKQLGFNKENRDELVEKIALNSTRLVNDPDTPPLCGMNANNISTNWQMMRILFLSWCSRNRPYFIRERLIESTLSKIKQDRQPTIVKVFYPLSNYLASPPTAVYRAVTLFALFLFSYNIPAIQIKEDYYYKLGAYLNFLSLGSASAAVGFALGLIALKFIYNRCYDHARIETSRPEANPRKSHHWQHLGDPSVKTSSLIQKMNEPTQKLKVGFELENAPPSNIRTLAWYLVTCPIKQVALPLWRMTWPIIVGIAYYAPLYDYINSEVIPNACDQWAASNDCIPTFKNGKDIICHDLPSSMPLCPPEKRFELADLCFNSAFMVNALRLIPFGVVLLIHSLNRYGIPSKAGKIISNTYHRYFRDRYRHYRPIDNNDHQSTVIEVANPVSSLHQRGPST